jgi:hypothetical protein
MLDFPKAICSRVGLRTQEWLGPKSCSCVVLLSGQTSVWHLSCLVLTFCRGNLTQAGVDSVLGAVSFRLECSPGLSLHSLQGKSALDMVVDMGEVLRFLTLLTQVLVVIVPFLIVSSLNRPPDLAL